MIKCPFCHFDNEDGALFCERCSSDLSNIVSTPAASAPPPPPPIPLAIPEPLDAIPMADPIPIEDPIPMAIAEPLPLATAEPISPGAPEPLPLAMPEPIAEPEPVAMPLEMSHMPAAAPVPAMDLTPPAPVPLAIPEPVPAPPPPPAPEPVAAPAPPPPAPEPAPAIAGQPIAAASAPSASFPPGAQPRLQVLRGQKRNVEYPIFEGLNYIGRADEKPVDIDLEEQEPPDRIWCSRQHAVITFENGSVTIEDLNSANGTYVNRTRVYPGQQKPLAVNDIVQIGNVQMKVIV